MKIGIIGYGKMGKSIELMAVQQNHVVSGIARNTHQLKEIPWHETDVVLEFTTPEAAPENIKYCLDLKVPVISGTTGWLDRKPEVDDFCKSVEGTFFYASNFSIGMNLLFEINKQLARLMNNQPEFTASIEEIHHIHKKDAPSGTAISLAENLLLQLDRYNKWINNETPNLNELPVKSRRFGEVPGTHKVIYNSELESVELTHTAHHRNVFARGVIAVAEWIQGKKGVLNMEDFLKK